MTPDPLAEDPLARISLEPAARVSADDEELFRAIPNGHTDRQPFDDRDLPDELTERLLADTHEDGVWLHLASGADRIAIAELIAEGDGTQWSDERFRRERASWMHPNRSPGRDGMRGYGFGFAELM